jgi:hypothetical protein
VRATSSDRVVRHCAESPSLTPLKTLASTGHRQDSLSPGEELPGPDGRGNGVADE